MSKKDWNHPAIRRVVGSLLFEAAASQAEAGIEDFAWHSDLELAISLDCPKSVVKEAMNGIEWGEDEVGKVDMFLIERSYEGYRAARYVVQLALEWDGRRPPDTRPPKGTP